MFKKIGVLIVATLVALLGLNLIINTPVFAQSYDDFDWDTDYDYDYDYGYDYSYSTTSPVSPAVVILINVCSCLVALASYIYMSVSLAKIAGKTGLSDKKILAWIPIANLYLMLLIAKKPAWWLILLFIPLVNLSWIVLGIIVWMEIAKAVKHPSWMGILMIVPVIGMFIPGYLAFVEGKEA